MYAILSFQITLESLPSQSAILNPEKPLWRWLKYDRLITLGPQNAVELNQRCIDDSTPIRRDRGFRRSLLHASVL